MAPENDIAALVARGDYVGAARRAEEAGLLARAIALYERVWRFAEAAPLAERLGDRPLAVRLLLDARLEARAVALAGTVPAERGEELLAVAGVFAQRARWLDAAPLYERAGAHAKAAELYRKGGAILEAARAAVRAGDWPLAGRLYEEVVASALADGDLPLAARARLGLGSLLGQLGRPREAARALQTAAEQREVRAEALAELRLCLLALDLPHAATAIEAELARGRDAEAANARGIPALARAEAEMDTPAPLPRFSDLVLIGAGSLGRVYRAHDHLLNTTVVLKMLAVGAGTAGVERHAFRQFLREAEASGRLRHPAIVRVYDLDERAGLLVLEYLPGGTLAARIAQGPLAPAVVRRIALDLLSALGAAHRAGIVHRDVKPANIFLDAAGNAKLADFGAAHLADFGGTQTAGFIGTLGYLSPEQIAGGSIGPAADLYALGATLFEALTGRLPFLGPDIAGQHLGSPAPRPSLVNPAVDPRCDDVIVKALAKSPPDRFVSAEAMAEAIRAWPAAAAPPGRSLTPSAPVHAVSEPSREGTPTPSPEGVPQGKSARGPLVLRPDARLGRVVLAELLERPLDPDGRAAIARLAAAGGPVVQRVLRLDEASASEGGAVIYEALLATPTPLGELSAAEQAALAEGWAALADGPGLPALGLRPTPDAPVVRTAGGPVIVVVRPT